MVMQLSWFFKSGLFMITMISKVVYLDRAFRTCKWLGKKLSDLLYSLEIYVNVIKTIYNHD